MRKSSNHYGEWTLNGLQQMSLFFKDVGGQGKKVQGADKDTETKISSVWKNKVTIPILIEKKVTIVVFGGQN